MSQVRQVREGGGVKQGAVMSGQMGKQGAVLSGQMGKQGAVLSGQMGTVCLLALSGRMG